jgi:5-methylcytosine-specific restriction endonuclease McrA
MSNVLQQKRVLRLNNAWKAYDVLSVQDSFVAMSRERRSIYTKDMKRPYFALHIDYAIVDGVVDFTQPTTWLPVEWKDWIELPVRNFDEYVTTSSKLIRVPTVIIANNYRSIPNRPIAYSKSAVWERDNYTCQVTGEKVSRKNANIEHLIPKSKGGKTNFTNTYLVRKDINQKKGNLSPQEFEKKFGYKLPKKLEIPARRDRVIENTYNIVDWNFFLER